MNQFALCEHFHCTPPELKEIDQVDIDEALVILEVQGQISEIEKKKAERMARQGRRGR